MKTFLTLILITGLCFAEEPIKPLPKDVQTIVDSREKALQEARIAFDKAVFKANDDAVKKMESVVKTSTQKGDLDGALASKKFVEDWNKEKETAAVSGALGGNGPGESLVITKAEYGADTRWVDVTEKIIPLVIDNRLSTTVKEFYKGPNPAPNVVKSIKIQYLYKGKKLTLNLSLGPNELGQITLPPTK